MRCPAPGLGAEGGQGPRPPQTARLIARPVCNRMARPRPKKRARQNEPVQADFYEAEEREPDEEKFSGQRYDVRPAKLLTTLLFSP